MHILTPFYGTLIATVVSILVDFVGGASVCEINTCEAGVVVFLYEVQVRGFHGGSSLQKYSVVIADVGVLAVLHTLEEVTDHLVRSVNTVMEVILSARPNKREKHGENDYLLTASRPWVNP